MSIIRTIALILLPIIKIICYIFYDKKYLLGKYYDKSFIGWMWALKGILWQKLLGYNRSIPWPVSPLVIISNKNNIIFYSEDLHLFQPKGIYYQNFSAKIIIGKGTWIAQNVGLITANHDFVNPDEHLPGKDIILGKQCWVGMNAVILPGIILGDHTVVGAGAVVTKSFPDGYVVIAGNPAKIIRHLQNTMDK